MADLRHGVVVLLALLALAALWLARATVISTPTAATPQENVTASTPETMERYSTERHIIRKCYEYRTENRDTRAAFEMESGVVFTVDDGYLSCYNGGAARVAEFRGRRLLCVDGRYDRGRCYRILGEGRA